MTEEQFNKAIELNGKLNKLYCAKKEIGGKTRHRLSYIERRDKQLGDTGDDWRLSDVDDLEVIGHILDRHDVQIRQELEDEINKIKQEIKKL